MRRHRGTPGCSAGSNRRGRRELGLFQDKKRLGLEERGQRCLRLQNGGHAAEWFVDTAEKGEQQRGVVEGLFEISKPISDVLKPLGELEHR